MIGLDTNVIIRYLAQDDRGQSVIATRLIEGSLTSENPGFVPLVVLTEIVWVLEDCYVLPRSSIGEIVERLLRVRQIQVQDADTAWQALRLFRAGNCDFADCLIARVSAAHECERTVTFDKAAARGAGMHLLGA